MRRTLAAPLSAVLLALPSAAGHATPRPPCPTRVERVAGGSWEARPVQGIGAVAAVRDLAADQRDPRVVVVADSEGVLVTKDGGCTWRRAAEYTDFVAPLLGDPIDVAVAGSGPDRSFHVLVARWEGGVPNGPAKLLSSYDDGATWTAIDAPAAAGPASFVSLSLTASPADPGVVYLLVRHSGATGAVYAGDGRGGWRWQSATVYSAAPGTCVPGATCLTRLVDSLHADPNKKGVLWGFSGAGAAPDSVETLGYSPDGGVSWRHRPVPTFSTGVSLVDVAPAPGGASVMLLGDFWEYAVSKDEGRSWAVGEIPQVVSADGTSAGVFDVAHFHRGRAAATVLGQGPRSGWAGNVLVFDGTRWLDASPPGFAGYDRTDAEGNPRSFVALASTDGPLFALSAAGELMAYRR